AHRYRGHALADRLDDAATLVAEDAGEDAFGVLAGQGIGVGVANTGGDDAYQHFAGLGRFDVHLDDLQRLVGAEGDGGARFDGHERCPPGWMRQSVVSFTCWVNEPIVETLLLPRDNPKLAEGSRYESLGRSRRVRRRCRVRQLHARRRAAARFLVPCQPPGGEAGRALAGPPALPHHAACVADRSRAYLPGALPAPDRRTRRSLPCHQRPAYG